MEKESITIKIELENGSITSSNHFRDRREITVQATRGELTKKLDDICAEIDESFEH